MKLVDLNVLLYATDADTKHHRAARRWLDAAMTGTDTVGLPVAVTVGFVRLTTNPRVLRRPLAPAEAIGIVRVWLGRSNVTVPAPTERHFDVLQELLEATGTGGNLVSDAHLAALAIEHGASVCTFDGDFDRFPGVVTVRPT